MKPKPLLALIPDDYCIAVGELNSKPRWHTGWQADVFKDTVGGHILRCAKTASEMDLPQEQRDRIIRILSCHELPEDQVLVKDISWLNEYISAGFWMFGTLTKKCNDLAVLAKAIELTDNTHKFYEGLAYWMKTNRYSPALLPPQRVITQYLDMCILAKSSIEKETDVPEGYVLAYGLLNKTCAEVLDLWGEVPSSRLDRELIMRLAEVEANIVK